MDDRVLSVIIDSPRPVNDLPWDLIGPLERLEQAEFAGAGDRCGAVLNAQFAVQGALVGLDGVQ